MTMLLVSCQSDKDTETSTEATPQTNQEQTTKVNAKNSNSAEQSEDRKLQKSLIDLTADFSNENTEEIAAGNRVPLLDNMTFALTPGQKLDGPEFHNTPINKSRYGTEYLQTLMQEADKIASSYKRQGDLKAYYAFMMTALVVPLHEGLWMHFRKTTDIPGVCNPYAQSGLTMINPKEEDYRKMSYEEIEEKKQKEAITLRNFNKALKTGSTPFLANCDEIRNDQVVRYIIRGYDGSDLGAMQLSIRWHLDKFFAKQSYKSLRKTFAYGLNFLHDKSFAPLYQAFHMKKPDSTYMKKVKKKTKSCLRNGFFDRDFNFENLIRASWAGTYNSGSIYNACRFKKQDLSADKWFYNNIKKIYGFLFQEKLGYREDVSFVPSRQVKGALDEIICHYNYNTKKLSDSIDDKKEAQEFDQKVQTKCSQIATKGYSDLRSILSR